MTRTVRRDQMLGSFYVSRAVQQLSAVQETVPGMHERKKRKDYTAQPVCVVQGSTVLY